MVRKYYSVVLFVLALLFAGCSNHPPSAAQFMNVKKEEGKFNKSFIIGASLRSGDIYKGTSHIHEDYDDEEGFANSDFSLLFRYSHFVAGGSFENMSFRYIMGFRSQYIGLQGWAGMGSDKKNEAPISGGLMLIEEIPICDEFRVGLSEYIANNGYSVDENLGGLGFRSTHTYSEFGIGAYFTYEDFSFEFRYGREIDEPRNRFYFMTHYAIFN